MTVCSQYLRNVSKVFKLFPILITILSVWGLCAILTVTEAISPDNGARTDKNIELLYKADWFRFPYPCEYYIVTTITSSHSNVNIQSSGDCPQSQSPGSSACWPGCSPPP